MSLEQKIEALTAALEANTAALLGGAKASTTKADKPADTAAAAKPGKAAKAAAYEAKHTATEAQAAIQEVKEKLGIADAKAIIAKCGGVKMADLKTPEQFDQLYELSKAALGDTGSDDDGDM